MRDVFDLMATDTDDDWAMISRRLSRVPDRVAGYADVAARSGGSRPSTRRPAGGTWHRAGRPDPAAVRRHGRRRRTRQRCAARRAAASVRRQRLTRTAGWRQCCATRSARTPAVRTRSAATPTGCSRGCTSARTIDFDETYEWGLDHLQSIVAEQESIAHRLYPGSSVAEALRRLDDEPRYLVRGHRRPAGMDAGAVRPRGGRAGGYALRDRRAAATPGVHDRAHSDRRASTTPARRKT